MDGYSQYALILNWPHRRQHANASEYTSIATLLLYPVVPRINQFSPLRIGAAVGIANVVAMDAGAGHGASSGALSWV